MNILITIVFSLFIVLNTFADIIHVHPDSSTIQEGIDMAKPGDTVLVAEGRYVENPKITNKAIVLASHFILEGDTSYISKTIIDGSQPAVTDSATTVLIRFNPEDCPVLCGFTITGGYGTIAPDDTRSTGGIAVIASNAIVEHNIINGNIIDHTTVPEDYPSACGGGISALPLFYNNINVIIRDNTIKNNRVEGNDLSSGGGIGLAVTADIKNFNFLVERNLIENNTVKNEDDWKAMGGGIYLELAIPTSGEQIIRNNIIRRNSVECEHSFGGGIYVVFVENKADGNVDTSHGPYIYNNIIANNHSDFSGGGIAFFRIYKPTPGDQPLPLTSPGKYTPKPAFINNTIVNNTAPDGAGIFTMNHIPFFMNNILWNSYEPEAEWGEIFMGTVVRWLPVENNKYAGIEISYSDIQGGWEGKGNIDNIPLFADTLFHLSLNSPCKDTGHPDPGYRDADGTRNDMGCYGGIPDSIHKTFTFIEYRLTNSILNDFMLFQNYPNPFNPLTTIEYQLPQPSDVNLSIYNILGQRVDVLVSARQPAGLYKVHWNAKGITSGTYFYRLTTDDGFSQIRKLIILK